MFDMNYSVIKKSLYSFGDSIIAGHTFPLGFVDYVCQQQGLEHQKFAVNGASVVDFRPERNWIMAQIQQAPLKQPDIIVFDGGTNDIFQHSLEKQTKSNMLDQTRLTTFILSFRQLVEALKEKWPAAKLIYVVPHKMGSLDIGKQEAYIVAALEVCHDYDIVTVDVYHNSLLDTSDKIQRERYSFDRNNDEGLPGRGGSGTHPNLRAIEEFYVPLLTSALLANM